MVQAIVATAAMTVVLLCCYRHRRRKATVRHSKQMNAREERERQREAHYMRNFWNYDGSEQEEFEG